MSAIFKPSRDKEAQLRGLASQKGYELKRSPMSYHWLLFGSDGEQAKTDKGHPSFTVGEAIVFLKGEPDKGMS